MASEITINRLENVLNEVADFSGSKEKTTIVSNMEVVNAAPTGLSGFVTIKDDRDGDTILASTVPGITYQNGDLVNVLFIDGTEPIAFQQASASGGVGFSVDRIYESDFGAIAGQSDAAGNFVWENWVSADAQGFIVENTSGAAAAANDLGYIDEAGEYKTTTTANDDVSWCVVLQGAANNADIYVARRGRVTVAYTGGAPSAGDFLITSTSAGDASATSTMTPEIFGVALANGSGGTVSALLLTQRKTFPIASAENLVFVNGASDSDFVSTIAAAGVVGDKIYYNAPSAGNVDTITPVASTELAKMLIHNTTQVELAGIIATGTDGTGDFIQVETAADIAAWVATDAITAESQTNTSSLTAGVFFYDAEVTSSEMPELTTALLFTERYVDSGGTGQRFAIHPFEANSNQKRIQWNNTNTTAGTSPDALQVLPLFQRRFCFAWDATGAATALFVLRPRGFIVAAP